MTFPIRLQLVDPGALVVMLEQVVQEFDIAYHNGSAKSVAVYLDLKDGCFGAIRNTHSLGRLRQVVLGKVTRRASGAYVFHGPLWSGFEDELVDVFASRGLTAVVARPRAKRK